MLEAALRATPWVVPGSLIVIAVSGWNPRQLARALRTTHRHAFGLTASLGVVLLVTLSPSPDAGSGRKSFASFEVTLDAFRNLGEINETTLNIALFVPLGLLAALHRTRQVRTGLIALACAVPLVVETSQYAFPSLGRSGFQMNDVIANLLGVMLGLGLGSIARRSFRGRANAAHSRSDPAATSG